MEKKMKLTRRGFLKSLGLLAITAPVGIAALKQMEFEPEIDPAVFADVAEKASEVAGKMGRVAQCAQDCADAMVPFVPKTYNGLPIYTAEEIDIVRDPYEPVFSSLETVERRYSPAYCLAKIAKPPFPSMAEMGERVAVRFMNSLTIYEGALADLSVTFNEDAVAYADLHLEDIATVCPTQWADIIMAEEIGDTLHT